ncbi:MAG: hypothetical protein ABI691_21330 [Ginsengibacter sp.]
MATLPVFRLVIFTLVGLAFSAQILLLKLKEPPMPSVPREEAGQAVLPA